MKENQRNLSELPDTDWLKKEIFSNTNQRLSLKKGETLLHQHQTNDRLYFIDQGHLIGYYPSDSDSDLEIFNSTPRMVVGIYSFFSTSSQSYTTVIAQENTELSYIMRSQIPTEFHPNYIKFMEHIVPVLVNEIYLRQMMVVKKAEEKQLTIKKLLQSEKLATLGQLAAGLAHELNNAIGVIHNKTLWLTHQMKDYVKSKNGDDHYRFFIRGLEKGQTISSDEIRRRKKVLISEIGLSQKAAKKIAKFNLSETEIKLITDKRDETYINQANECWETGLALHDIQIASSHTTHVIKSIKDLGARNRDNTEQCDLRLTIKKALSLLSNPVKQVNVNVEVEKGLFMLAKEGDLIQIWINLIKNALESLINSRTLLPQINIQSENNHDSYTIKIIDNGPGIPEGLLTKIFRPNVTTKIDGLSFGLGLGLSIVQKIIQSYNGNITVESKPQNTVFKVQFPKVL